MFNLVCKIYDYREQYKCLAPLDHKLDLKALCPFNFHLLEPVRYSYNLLIFKVLSTQDHNLKIEDLQLLHTLVIQSLAVETSSRLVELLLKVLALIVRAFASADNFVDQ